MRCVAAAELSWQCGLRPTARLRRPTGAGPEAVASAFPPGLYARGAEAALGREQREAEYVCRSGSSRSPAGPIEIAWAPPGGNEALTRADRFAVVSTPSNS